MLHVFLCIGYYVYLQFCASYYILICGSELNTFAGVLCYSYYNYVHLGSVLVIMFTWGSMLVTMFTWGSVLAIMFTWGSV